VGLGLVTSSRESADDFIGRNDNYTEEKDVDVQAVVADTLRQRGFGVVEDDERMDES